MRKKKKRSSPLGLILFLALALISAVLVHLSRPETSITMLGEEDMTVEYGSEFVDPCVEIRRAGKYLRLFDSVELVPATANMTTDTLGRFKLEYVVTDHGKDLRFYRFVNVVDTTPPEITVTMPEREGGNSWMHGYAEPTVSAIDLLDGDLSDQVTLTIQDGKMIYSVSDSQGNEGTLITDPPAGSVPPEIVLTGGEEIDYPSSLTWADPGWSVIDSDGTDLSDLVEVSGTVRPQRLGDYTIYYALSNEQGQTIHAQRTVHVVKAERVQAVQPEGKTIYLTFDDGPGPYTDQLLDLLAQYDVKATFFVTGIQPDYFDCIRRAHEEGHSIGVHTYSHNYDKVYASEQAFYDDFTKCEDLIYEYTGSYTKLFRFPGGSSNTVSSFNPGIMSRLVSRMTDMGYYYFDWNVSSGDAAPDPILTYTVYENVINGCAKYDTCVVLQHDVKDFSVNAVERIIQWGLNNGYQFLPLQEDSYGAWHRVFN